MYFRNYNEEDGFIKGEFSNDAYKSKDGTIVITSYSIHYTKLYEPSSSYPDHAVHPLIFIPGGGQLPWPWHFVL